ncbi:MAG: phosphate transport system substrate-binding protein [Desulfobacteraceae bacterium Eth-SRB1]|nr:MAG: phosphate transport system substrate-binding protein [Desulfobacteraceae bacterium Eth-SRB1]
MKTRAIWIIISVVAAAGIINLPLFFNDEQNNRLDIKGSTTVCPIIMRCLDLFKKDYSEALITVTKSGSGSGIAALLDGTADIAMSSRPLTEKEKSIIAEKGLKIDRIVIGLDGIAIIVHAQNPIDQISIKQLRDIYTGKITDWKELGCTPGKIIPVSRDVSSGTFVIFGKKILGSEKLRPDVQLVPSNRVMVQSVAANKESIGYAGLGYVDKSVKALAVNGCHTDPTTIKSGKYPLSRELFLFTRDDFSELKKNFLEFVLSPEGQRIVREEGFVAATNQSNSKKRHKG